MSDTNPTIQNTADGTGGGDEQFSWRNLPGGEEFAEGMAAHAKGLEGDSDDDSDIGERMRAEDFSGEDAPQETATRSAKPVAAQDMQSLMLQMQQQQLQMFNEMQQQFAMSQSQSVAQAVQAALAAMGLGQRAPEPEPDPIESLDPDDPDYFFKKTDAELNLLKRQNQELVARLEGERQQQMMAIQQQQQMQAQQTFVNQVNSDLGRAVDYVFDGWPDSPQVQSLKKMAADTVDAEWHAHGYKPEGYAKGIRKAQEMMKSMENLKHTFAAGAPRSTAMPPVGRGTNPPSSTAEQGGLTWRQMFDNTRRNDAAALREAIKNGMH